MAREKIRTTVELTPELTREWEELSVLTAKSKTDILRRALQIYVRRCRSRIVKEQQEAA